MKTFLLISAIALPLALHAQTNVPAPATNAAPPPAFAAGIALTNSPAHTNAANATNVVVRPPTDIFSDQGDFDFKTRQAIYTGNVRVVDSQMNMTCELLTVSVPEHGGRVNHIVAERNVIIDAVDEQGKPVHATADKAVYTYQATNTDTNEVIELTGHPHIESQLGPSSGDPIIWNRTKNTVHAVNVGMRIQQPGVKAPTNSLSPFPIRKK